MSYNKSLHIVASSLAAENLLKAFALNERQILICEDNVSIGLSIPVNSWTEWRAIRGAYLTENGLPSPKIYLDQLSENSLFDNIKCLEDAEEVFIWAGIGSRDQFFLALTMFIINRNHIDIRKIRLVIFEKHLANFLVFSPAELPERVFRKHIPPAFTPSAEQIEALVQGWIAYTAPHPKAFLSYLEGADCVPYFKETMQQLAFRYPDKNSGLGLIDYRMLEMAREYAPSAVKSVGRAMASFCDFIDMGYENIYYCINDDFLYFRLLSMADPKLSSPLIAATGNPALMRECSIEVTPFGEAVLAGEANNVEVNGIDDWIGGVHLKSPETVIYQDKGHLLL